MAANAKSSAEQALTLVRNTGIPLAGPLVDNTGLGSFWIRVGVAIGTGNTSISHNLGRKPTMYLVARNSSGGVVYDGTNHGTDWTGGLIVLRATVAGTYSLLIG